MPRNVGAGAATIINSLKALGRDESDLLMRWLWRGRAASR